MLDQTIELVVNEDGQLEVVCIDIFETKKHVVSCAKSHELATTVLETQRAKPKIRGGNDNG